MTQRTRLHVVYILPSRYDDEGYPLRFWRGILPSNTLCYLKSLTEGAAQRGELGEGVEVTVEIFDDSVRSIPVKRIARKNRRPDTQVVVGMVGVQSNQFPRAADLALEFRAWDLPVLIGGFHVSGVLAMFGAPTPELQTLINQGVSMVRGEVDAPGVLAGILKDAMNGRLQPIYNIAEAPQISDAPIPAPDPSYLKRFVSRRMGTIDTSRGCPFNCSFCTIINVQGRKMRHRSTESMLASIEANYEHGIDFYFFTDDNFARSPIWPELFYGLARLRAEGKPINFMMQVDTQATRIPNFVEKAAAAGCYLVFIGMESVNAANLAAAGKRQNKVDEFAAMVDAWHQAEVLTHAGFIIGFPNDTAESIRRDVAFLKDVVKIDEASFFMLTPLPGSRDHKQMVEKKVPLDADLNNYDSFHETFRHQNLQPGQWHRLYREAYDTFYSKESIVNVLLRTPRRRYWEMFKLALWNRHSTLLGSHPMVTGFFRMRERKSRRPIFARETHLQFLWRQVKDIYNQARIFGRLFYEFQEVWLLTRHSDDPRWRVLSELRSRWAEVQQRIVDHNLLDRCDEAAQELRAMLSSAAEHLNHLSTAGKAVPGRARRRMQRKVREIRAYLRTIDVQVPTWRQVVQAEQYVSESIVAAYEELAIRHVAQRRRINAYGRDVVQRIKTGHILSMNVSALPKAAFFEVLLAARFSIALVTGFASGRTVT